MRNILLLALALGVALGAGCLTDEGNKVGAPGYEPNEREQMDQDDDRETDGATTRDVANEDGAGRG